VQRASGGTWGRASFGSSETDKRELVRGPGKPYVHAGVLGIVRMTTSPPSGTLTRPSSSFEDDASVPTTRLGSLQDDLEPRYLGGIGERVVGLHDVVESESVRDQRRGLQ
jgi:hypothetical protein